MPNKIERLSSASGVITVTNSPSTSPRLPFGASAGGIMFVTAVSSATRVTWHVALDASSTPLPLHSDGAVVETAVAANRAYPLPDAVFGAPFLVGVTDAGTATIQLTVKG